MFVPNVILFVIFERYRGMLPVKEIFNKNDNKQNVTF